VSIQGNVNTITELFRAVRTHWETADRATYCAGTVMPRKIHFEACETN
jgi:hypothetical protein